MQDPAARRADAAALLSGLRSETVPGAREDGETSIAFLGSDTPRERIWLQFDAAADDTAMALAAWAAVESLRADRVNRYKQPVIGRARIAVVLPPPAAPLRLSGSVPFLDAGTLGAPPALLAALRRFGPSLVVHVQDWTGAAETLDGVRQVESFRIDPDVHGALPRYGHGTRWRRSRRAYHEVSEGPDWQVGAGVAAYVRRMGYRTAPALGAAERERAIQTVHELAAGRYAPASEWRRLGGGNLAELALAETGAHGITGQVAGEATAERAGQALAVAEGAVVHRMNVAQDEPGR